MLHVVLEALVVCTVACCAEGTVELEVMMVLMARTVVQHAVLVCIPVMGRMIWYKTSAKVHLGAEAAEVLTG